MQDRLIEACYVWTEDEFVVGTRNVHRYTEGLIVKVGIPFLIAVFVFASVVLMSDKSPVRASAFAPLLGGVFLIYMFYLGGRERGYRRAFRRAGVLNQADQKVILLFDERWVRITTAGSETSCIWELVPTVIHVPSGFLVKCAGFHRWLPHHAFRNEDDRDAFTELASRRATKFVEKS